MEEEGDVAYKWINTKYEGIRYREHPSRTNGVRKDRYYSIRYRIDAKDTGDVETMIASPSGKPRRVRVEEGLGWESQGWTLEKVRDEFAKLNLGRKTADGPATMAEKRKVEEMAKAEAERADALKRASSVTLKDYFEQDYLPTAKQKKKPESWGREVSLFQNWIEPLLGHIFIQEIGVTQWDFLLTAMVDGGLSPRTRQYACLTLRLVLEHAFARRKVSEMPPRAKLIGATLKPDSNRRTRTVTPQELQAILDSLAVRDPHAYRLTLFCALSCCRFSEAAKLEWRDVDLGIGKALFRNTKNGTSREIPLSETLIEMLRDMGPSEAQVFLGSQGKSYAQAPTSFREVVEDLGFNEGRSKLDRLVFHSLRHSGATRLGQSGIPLRDMMDLAGWKTPSMALRYQHSGDAGRRRAMAALESMTRVEPAKVLDLYRNNT